MMWKRAKSRLIVFDAAIAQAFTVSKALHPSGTMFRVANSTAAVNACIITLPPPNGDLWECTFLFRNAIPAGGTVSIRVAQPSVFRGVVQTANAGTGAQTAFLTGNNNLNNMTLAPATSGGVSFGEFIRLIDLDGTPCWQVFGQLVGTAPATPFSLV